MTKRGLPRISLLALLGVSCAFGPHAGGPRPGVGPDEGPFLSEIQQLSFAGRRTGEGYFSADGREIVFQSEREPGNPFYQIYRADLENGEIQRVSTGVGKTTCGWIHPFDGRVLFSSTHHDPSSEEQQREALEKRASGETSRYAWDYDPQFELYLKDAVSGELTRLASAYGYDAEGSISPDGEWVVFASNRHAYSGTAETLENPSREMDLYRVRVDGTDLQRLTDAPGYDGGPFFSADGSEIVWRRFSPDGHQSEIYRMPSEGGEAQQLTRRGLISWAPYFHPSREYVIYAAHAPSPVSDAADAANQADWNLFLVDHDGQREPIQVTTRSGFDGLPVFSPSGDELVWSRSTASGTQLFRAKWNHALALSKLRRDAGAAASAPPETSPPPAGVSELRAHVEALASEAMAGRATGTPGEQLAAQYAADFFAGLGLEPAGDGTSFFQQFEFTAGVELAAGNRLLVTREAEPDRAFELGNDWSPLALSSQQRVAPAAVVFAGYGIVAPASAEQEAYDSYGESDVEGKWVAVLRFAPESVPAERRQYLNRHAGYRYKAMLARERGASGILLLAGPRTELRNELIPLRADASLAGSQLAAVSLSKDASGALLGDAGLDLDELQQQLDRGASLPVRELPGLQVSANLALRFEKASGRNVLARLPGASDRPPVIVGAHIDHLGRGTVGSLAKRRERDEIHYGADDNASGTAGLFHVAAKLAARTENFERDVIFAAWSGEELGLIGSGHYARRLLPENPHDPEAERVVAAYLNMDMIGRLDDSLLLSGTGSSAVWTPLIEAANYRLRLPLELQADAYLPTDSTSFYVRGIPVLSAFTGAHSEYHTPRDTPETLNYEGILRVAELGGESSSGLAASPALPDFVAMSPPTKRSRTGLRVYLGTVPDYGQGEKPGVALQGVVPGGPADLAGLRSGDVIVELDGQSIENIYDFTFAIGRLAVGEASGVVVTRGTKRVRLEITPASRQ